MPVLRYDEAFVKGLWWLSLIERDGKSSSTLPKGDSLFSAGKWRGYLFAGRGLFAGNFVHLLPASMDTVVKRLLTFK